MTFTKKLSIEIWRKCFLIVFIFFLSNFIFSQNEDNIWMMGYTYFTPQNPDINKFEGTTVFDFNTLPIQIYRIDNQVMNFSETVTNICDKNGNLLFYSNGMFINNSDYEVMTNGDSIAYGENWEKKVITINEHDFYRGFSIIQGALSLPIPESINLYIMIYQNYNESLNSIGQVFYSIIDMNMNEGKGEVIVKDELLLGTHVGNEIVPGYGKISACKHGNGRDWWIFIPYTIENKIQKFLLTPDGIELTGIGEIENKISEDILGQSSFSPNGEHYAFWGGLYLEEPGHIRLYDFDRCSGELSNEQSDSLLTAFGNGLCFSPNGEFLYISHDVEILQYEVNSSDFASSRTIVATWDEWENEYGNKYTLGYMAMGQDGIIYVIPNNNNSEYIHQIKNPDYFGSDCNVIQHSIKLPTKVGTARTVPNYPNFRLGPKDDSYCDTLEIDNHPIAWFSFEQDSLDLHRIYFKDLSYFEPKNWSWDFGNGLTSLDINPSHIYNEKGVYEVCLTVSNENSSNKNCQSIEIGGMDIGKDIVELDVNVFPNPVKDVLIVNFSSFIPENALIIFYNQIGSQVTIERIFYGWNSLNLCQLPKGLYFYQILDRRKILKMGSIVKQ